MKVVIPDKMTREEANHIMVNMRKRSSTLAFARFHIYNDGSIGNVNVPLILEHIGLVYLIDKRPAAYEEVLKVPTTKEFECRILVDGGRNGRTVRTSDIKMHKNLRLIDVERDVVLFYLRPGMTLKVDLYARRGYSSEHVRWATFLFGSVVTQDTFTAQEESSPCYDEICDLELHLVSKGNVNMIELVDYMKKNGEVETVASVFVHEFENSTIIPLLYKMVDNYDDVLNILKIVNTRDISEEGLSNPEKLIGDVLYRLMASLEFSLYMAGKIPDPRIRSDIEVYNRFVKVITDRQTLKKKKRLTRLQLNVLNEDLSAPFEPFIWNFISTIISAVMLNGMYNIEDGADIPAIKAYFRTLFSTFVYAIGEGGDEEYVREDLVEHYSKYKGMEILDYPTSLYALRRELIMFMQKFNLYGLDQEDEVLDYVTLSHIRFMFTEGIAITRV